MPSNSKLVRDTFAVLRPPPLLSLSQWAEKNFVLAEGSNARPGRFRLWPYQRELLDVMGDPEFERVSVLKSARIGYALGMETPIATPSGWSTMGDLQIGDHVFDEAGKPCTVTCVSPVYTNHRCFKVAFCDGSSIVADADHRWAVESDHSFEFLIDRRFVRGKGARAVYTGLLDTETIFRTFRSARGRTRYTVPNALPLQTPDIALPIPPYTLGLWLGDGHSVTPRITQFSGDIETASYIEAEGIKVSIEHIDTRWANNRTYLLDAAKGERSPWAIVFRRCGLLMQTSTGVKGHKHIPPQYLRASARQRLELLRGLMDSDGTIAELGFAEFSVTSEELARGAYELVCSLGYKASWTIREPSREPHLRQYRVLFRPTPERNPFNLKRKADRVKPAPKPSITNRRRIVNVEEIEPRPVRCIEVDSPSNLYLAGRQMVPTHNTKCLMAAIGATVATDPSAIILLVPTDDDARRFAVDEVEPAFTQSPALKGLIKTGRIDGRNTLTTKSFVGGSLKILSSRSPRNLRSHDAKKLFIDEEDGMEITNEGDPIDLAEKRTLAHADRKIIRGSTPTNELTSTVSRAYLDSDQRVYEIPCPHCGALFELLWEHILWEKGLPETAVARCPHCEQIIEERFKAAMVAAGKWRATRPDVKGHAGFRLNTLISLLANARWPLLAAEFLRAQRGGPALMQVFKNTVLGQVWNTSLDDLDESKLRNRVEDFGILPDAQGKTRIPADCLLILAGVDTQDDRFEVALWGFNETEAFFLSHQVIWGDPADSVTKAELDTVLKTTWPHPNGWEIGIEAAAVDSAGHKTQAVYDFCAPRLARRIFPIIGRSGIRKLWAPSKSKTKDLVRIFIVGHDEAKTRMLERLVIPMLDSDGAPSVGRIRYSNDLPDESFEQLTAEKRVVRYVKNRAVIEFRPKRPGLRNEALDMACYALALSHGMKVNFAERRARRAPDGRPLPPRSGRSVTLSSWVGNNG